MTDSAVPVAFEGPATEPTTESPGPVDAVVRFEDLLPFPALVAAIRGLGFESPTPVQAAALPPALEGRDLVIQAKTGSGKTLVFSLPALAHLGSVHDPRVTAALVVSPTRELASQIRDVVKKLDPSIEPVCVIGGVSQKSQTDDLRRDARFVVGTPGRLLDLVRQRELRLDEVRFVALDEADEMLSLGFLEDVREILKQLPKERQGLFVSATVTPRVEMLAKTFLRRAERITVEATEEEQTIEHLYLQVGGDILAKPEALCSVLKGLTPRSAIVFCNTKSDTELVEAILRRRGFDAQKINSDLSQAERIKIMDSVRNERLTYLIATDVAARGLDIDHVDLVVHYALHDQPETYVHRSGRTGRAGRAGRSVCLVGPQDFGSFHQMKKRLPFPFSPLELPAS